MIKEVETIYYQGKRTAVQVVSEVNVRQGNGMDFLLRDDAGHYYFRREVYDEDVGYHRARSTRQYGYRCFLHRVSLAAAILWQVDFGAPRVFRSDAVDLLSGLRGRPGAPGADCVTVTLDEQGSELARRCLRYNEHAPVHHMDDLVNAAVAFFADDTDQGDSTLDFVEQARSRRLARGERAEQAGGKTAVTIHLSAAQLRMFQQIADYEPSETLAEVVTRELGRHVALHLGCYHGHNLEAACGGWAQEGKEPS